MSDKEGSTVSDENRSEGTASFPSDEPRESKDKAAIVAAFGIRVLATRVTRRKFDGE